MVVIKFLKNIFEGLQHGVLHANTPYGLQLDVTLLPEYLNQLGFKSHAVGKWHLGHYTKEHTPTFRGFASHCGYWLGKEDYYDHSDDNGKPVDAYSWFHKKCNDLRIHY